jgi:hypothetical protein
MAIFKMPQMAKIRIYATKDFSFVGFFPTRPKVVLLYLPLSFNPIISSPFVKS